MLATVALTAAVWAVYVGVAVAILFAGGED